MRSGKEREDKKRISFLSTEFKGTSAKIVGWLMPITQRRVGSWMDYKKES